MFAELFLGLPFFPGVSTHDQISRIVDMLGLILTVPLARVTTRSNTSRQAAGAAAVAGAASGRPQWTNASLDESVESLHALDFDDDGTAFREEESEPFSLKSAEQAREKGNNAPPKTKSTSSTPS